MDRSHKPAMGRLALCAVLLLAWPGAAQPLPTSCADGQIVVWNNTANAWQCGFVGTAQIDQDSISEALLQGGIRDSLEHADKAAVAADIRLSGRTLTFPDAEGTTNSVALPADSTNPTDAEIDRHVKPAAQVGGPKWQPTTDLAVPSAAFSSSAPMGTDDAILVYDETASEFREATVRDAADALAAETEGDDHALAYSLPAHAFALTSGHAAGATHDTGLDVEGGDRTLTVTASGLSGAYQANVASLLALPDVAAGVNLLVAARTGDALRFTLQGREFYLAHNGDSVIVADGQVADQRTISIARSGHRLKDAADARKDAQWGYGDLATDSTGEIEFVAGTAGALKANLRGGVPFTAADETRLDGLHDPAPAFRAGGLTNNAPDHVQDILDAFDDGGWTNSTGNTDSLRTHPAVATATRTAAWTSSQAARAAYSYQGMTGPHRQPAFVAVRVPIAYEHPVERLRLRVGSGEYSGIDETEQWLNLDEAALVSTTSSYRYYSVEVPGGIPAADSWFLQTNSPFELDADRVSLADESVLDAAKADRTTADRGRFLGASATDENELALLDAPGGGLTQAQVDARIDAAIPAKRRVPDFVAGDAGEYVRANATGTGLEVAPLTVGTAQLADGAVTAAKLASGAVRGRQARSTTLTINLSGAFTPAAGRNADRAITTTEWDANGVINFTGGFSSGNHNDNPYVLTVPSSRRGPDGILLINSSTASIRVMTSDELRVGGRGVNDISTALVLDGDLCLLLVVALSEVGCVPFSRALPSVLNQLLARGPGIDARIHNFRLEVSSRPVAIPPGTALPNAYKPGELFRLTQADGTFAGQYARGGAGEAAWVPYTTSPAFNKTITLAAASGSGVGSHTNRKIVTRSSTGVVKSDWSALTLVADSSAVGGISATAGYIAFAEAGSAWISVSFDLLPNADGGAARLYSDFRGKLTRNSATTYPPELRTQTCYAKTDDSDTSNNAQGVPQQRCAGTWLFEAQAGDQVAIEWLAHLQKNSQADLVNTNSTIKVRLMN